MSISSFVSFAWCLLSHLNSAKFCRTPSWLKVRSLISLSLSRVPFLRTEQTTGTSAQSPLFKNIGILNDEVKEKAYSWRVSLLVNEEQWFPSRLLELSIVPSRSSRQSGKGTMMKSLRYSEQDSTGICVKHVWFIDHIRKQWFLLISLDPVVLGIIFIWRKAVSMQFASIDFGLPVDFFAVRVNQVQLRVARCMGSHLSIIHDDKDTRV